MNDATGECNGSFGEILQGFLPGGKKFLVNLKIRNRSRVKVSLSGPEYFKEKEDSFIASYRKYSKTYKIIKNILVDIGRHDDVAVAVDSNIPVGKGLSSSTADMVAGLLALQQILSISLKKNYISRMLTEIEPNDGIHYDGTSAYHHTTGELIWSHDYVPPLNIVGIDLGGEVDTVAFNSRKVEPRDEDMRAYAQLLDEAERAYAARDLAAICRVSTRSARMWQAVNPKPELDRVLALGEATGALGVVNTHSGTFLGMAFGAERRDLLEVIATIQGEFPNNNIQLFQSKSC